MPNVYVSDLQEAYLYIKNRLSNLDGVWTMKSWTATIELLYEYHEEYNSGLDVAHSGNNVFTIFYLFNHDQNTSGEPAQVSEHQMH
jgi:hypothetical protein